jgi:hypothetical protein
MVLSNPVMNGIVNGEKFLIAQNEDSPNPLIMNEPNKSIMENSEVT